MKKATSINGVRNCKATCKRIKLDYYLTPYSKSNSKWIKHLNIRPEIIKFIEEITGTKLTSLCLRGFYELDTKGKESINKNK